MPNDIPRSKKALALYQESAGRFLGADEDGKLYSFPDEDGGWSKRSPREVNAGHTPIPPELASRTGWPGALRGK
jgi:hypothetical protein